MQVKITKRGNSAGVNIHPFYLEKAGLEVGSNVLVDVIKGKIVITKKED